MGKGKMTLDEWESAILSAHATRNWTLGGRRGRIADELDAWICNELGEKVSYETTQYVIDLLDYRRENM